MFIHFAQRLLNSKFVKEIQEPAAYPNELPRIYLYMDSTGAQGFYYEEFDTIEQARHRFESLKEELCTSYGNPG